MDRVRRVFPGDRGPVVQELLLNECGDNLPLAESPALIERIRFAVLKLSGGDMEELKKHISCAQRDWRDVLVAAGFGNSLEAHRNWQP